MVAPVIPAIPVSVAAESQANAVVVTPSPQSDLVTLLSSPAPDITRQAVTGYSVGSERPSWSEALNRAGRALVSAPENGSALRIRADGSPTPTTSTGDSAVSTAIKDFQQAADSAAVMSLTVALPQTAHSSVKRIHQGQ